MGTTSSRAWAFGNALGQSLANQSSTAWDGTLYGSKAPSTNYLDQTPVRGIFTGADAMGPAIPEVQQSDGSWLPPGASATQLSADDAVYNAIQANAPSRYAASVDNAPLRRTMVDGPIVWDTDSTPSSAPVVEIDPDKVMRRWEESGAKPIYDFGDPLAVGGGEGILLAAGPGRAGGVRAPIEMSINRRAAEVFDILGNADAFWQQVHAATHPGATRRSKDEAVDEGTTARAREVLLEALDEEDDD